jgi:hypothetical protein
LNEIISEYKKNELLFSENQEKKLRHFFRNCKGQFKIGNNYIRLFNGFKTRILTKKTALILVQNINKLIFERLINNIIILIN